MQVKMKWSDKELELLLDALLRFIVDKEGRGFDWVSDKTKNDDLGTQFIERYPSAVQSSDFLHDAKNKFTKKRIHLSFVDLTII